VPVSFGSDGYRGVIGHNLSREIVARIVLGVADYLRGQNPQGIKGLRIPIGYDTRFLSLPLARFAATLLKHEGLTPLLCSRPCPSPYLAFATRHLHAPIGIEFTASHNPALYNGIKLKGAHGGSMLPSEVAMLEFYADAVQPERYSSTPISYSREVDDSCSLDREYTTALNGAAYGAQDRAQHMIVDYMHGCSAGIYRELLHAWFTIDADLRTNCDPLFGGGKPEPVPANLTELAEQVKLGGHDAIGVAFDGDGDRLAVVDETGRFLGPHEVLCILLEYIIKQRGPGGIVVKTVSLSALVDRVAEAHGCKVIEVPVGFKSVSDAMIENNAIIGGEESGGVALGHYLPERDALLMAVLMAKAKGASGGLLHELVDDMYSRFGRQHFIHRDVPLAPGLEGIELRSHLAKLANLGSIAGDRVDSLNHRDGMKLRTDAGWVLTRTSGTEPILRVYAEADTEDQANAYADAVLSYLEMG
jgi:phosphomannomutase